MKYSFNSKQKCEENLGMQRKLTLSKNNLLEFGKKALHPRIYYLYFYTVVYFVMVNISIKYMFASKNYVFFTITLIIIVPHVHDLSKIYEWKGNPNKFTVENKVLYEKLRKFIHNAKFEDKLFQDKAKKWYNIKINKILVLFLNFYIILYNIIWIFIELVITPVIDIYNLGFLPTLPVFFLTDAFLLTVLYYLFRCQLIFNIFPWSLSHIFYDEFKKLRTTQVEITSKSLEQVNYKETIELISNQIPKVDYFIKLNFFKALKLHNYNLEGYYKKMLFSSKSKVYELVVGYIDFLNSLKSANYLSVDEMEIFDLISTYYGFFGKIIERENLMLKKKKKILLVTQKHQLQEQIEITKNLFVQEQELSRLSNRLKIDKDDISMWLDNFQINEQKYALKLLEHLKIVSAEDLKNICEKLYKKILEKFNLQDLVFVSIGGEAKSDKYISYHFRLYNEILEEQFINQFEPKLKELNDKTIIYLDDISSTGGQLCDNWIDFSKRLKNEFIISNTFVFVPLFLTKKAKQRIEEETGFQVIFLYENLLTEKNNVLSEEAKIFRGEELKKATEIFSKYGRKLYPKEPLGFGNSALLLVFPYNTPNNTLPVIWGQSYDINFKWKPLFPRYESKKVKNNKLMNDIEVIEEKTQNLSKEFLSIQILREIIREKDNIKELSFRIYISNLKERTIENVVGIAKAYRLDRSVLTDSSECYWNVGTIDKTLNPGQVGTIDLLTLKITNNYWHVSSSYADDFRYGFTAGLGTIELIINTVNGKKIGYDSIFPANIIFEIKSTARDKPPFTKVLMFQIYNCLFTTDIFFKFDFYNKDDFLKELKIQQIVGTLSRSNLMLEPEAQHFKILNELLPDDYEKHLQEYLDRVDKKHHQKIQERLNMIKKFKQFQKIPIS